MKYVISIFLFVTFFTPRLFAAPHSSIIIPPFMPDTVCPNGFANFNLAGSTFTDSLTINWGDGSPIQTYTVNPNFRSHSFVTTSTVTVVTYEGILTDTARLLLVVIQMPQPKFSFSFNSLACYTQAGVQVTFSDSTTGGSPPFVYQWQFGDGTSDTARNPVHTYTSPGKYIITLKVIHI